MPTGTHRHTRRSYSTCSPWLFRFTSFLFVYRDHFPDPHPISLWTREAQVVDTALVCPALVLDVRVRILVLRIFRDSCIRLTRHRKVKEEARVIPITFTRWVTKTVTYSPFCKRIQIRKAIVFWIIIWDRNVYNLRTSLLICRRVIPSCIADPPLEFPLSPAASVLSSLLFVLCRLICHRVLDKDDRSSVLASLVSMQEFFADRSVSQILR